MDTETNEGLRFEPLHPLDEHNRRLESQVHPADWSNPKRDSKYHLVVLGAGTAGLVAAAGAAGLGARVALIERELMGGDCLNIGCVPSKSVIASARAAAAVRDASRFGIRVSESDVDFAAAMERMRRLRADISPADSAERFKNLGADVYFGEARFQDRNSIQVSGPSGDRTLRFCRAVIATGGRASVPPIPGLGTVDYLTNANLFSLTDRPATMGVIGGGPIGCEMAQAFARLGTRVQLFERSSRILSREDPAASELVMAAFERDGVQVHVNTSVEEVSRGDGRVHLQLRGDSAQRVDLDRLLVAVGRTPNVEGIGLEAAGVEFNEKGVVVNDFLQTTNPNVYAAGDVCSELKFTHAADFMSRIVVQNSLFALGPIGRKRVSQLLVPRCTYVSPEVASVGLSQEDGAAQGIAVDVFLQTFDHVDRAILDGAAGFVKAIVRKGTDRILGATVVGPSAGELICQLTVAIKNKVGLAKLGATIHPYPTLADAIRKLGDQYNRTRLTDRSKRILHWLRRLKLGE